MDRDRLKDVHATDLTESRVNEDFVDWLKTKGPTYLLVILVGVTAYLAVIRWRQHKTRAINDAWAALAEAPLPESKLDVAEDHTNVFAVPQLALNSAGAQLLKTVASDQPIDTVDSPVENPADAPKLTDSDRDEYLSRADRAFDSVWQTDDDTLRTALHSILALNGRAAVAESRGEIDKAREIYEQVIVRAQGDYPGLAEQAQKRIDNIEMCAEKVTFAQFTEAPPFRPVFNQASIEPALRDLLNPEK